MYTAVFVALTGPSLPVLPEPAVVGVSFELAIIRWISSSVSYTPDVFHIQYIEQETEQEPSVQTSETVMGTQDFLAVNEEYTLILDGLKSDTIYSFQVVASNTEGDVLSEPLNFRTREAGMCCCCYCCCCCCFCHCLCCSLSLSLLLCCCCSCCRHFDHSLTPFRGYTTCTWIVPTVDRQNIASIS